jgi:hypothetical protein
MPQVAYETLWDTTQFNNMWPADGSNPFFLSYNDNRGYGTHADYLFGWKDDSLQKAMDSNCMFQACENGKPLKSQSVAAMNKCAVKSAINENLDGCTLSSSHDFLLRCLMLIIPWQGSTACRVLLCPCKSQDEWKNEWRWMKKSAGVWVFE